MLFLYKKGDFSNYKDANVKVDVDIFYAHVNIVHIVDVDIAHHENEQLILIVDDDDGDPQVVLCFEEGTAQLPPPVRDFRFS